MSFHTALLKRNDIDISKLLFDNHDFDIFFGPKAQDSIVMFIPTNAAWANAAVDLSAPPFRNP